MRGVSNWEVSNQCINMKSSSERCCYFRLGQTNFLYANSKNVIQSKRILIWVASLSLVSFLHLSVLWSGRLTSYIKIYHLFVTQIYHINFSPVSELEFRLWRWNMTFLDTEMKELGRSTHIHKTRSLFRAPHVCLIHLGDRRSFHISLKCKRMQKILIWYLVIIKNFKLFSKTF